MNPPLKWHGGKYYLATKIIALMPPRSEWCHYVEPYAGGLSVLLANDPEGISECVNDIDGRLIGFWKCLANEAGFAMFLRMAQANGFSEPLYRASLNHLSQPCDYGGIVCPSCAFAFFVVCRQSLAGRMDSFAPLSKTRTRRGMSEQTSAWLTAVEGLPAVHGRLKRVVILGPKPALEVIRQQDGPKTLFYLDPPYLDETRASPDVYAHEMGAFGHNVLLTTLGGLQGKALLSGYRSPMYDTLLKNWNRHDFEIANHASGGDEKRRMVECVWCNF